MERIKIIILALSVAAIWACNKESNPGEEANPKTGILVLNNGNMGSNDASLSMYNLESREVTPQIFQSANGQKLGDLGQDMVVVGQELYITMNGSQVIFVTDMDFKIKETIVYKDDKGQYSPRYLTVSGGKVYVTYYEGYLGEIDPTTHTVRVTAVGSYPEGLCICKGKAYVANSGFGYDNTVSVVDLASFKETKRIQVNSNPQAVVADSDGKTLYVLSWDAYDPVTYAVTTPARLQSISLSDWTVTDLDYKDVKMIVAGKDDTLYLATGGYDSNWQIAGSVSLIDMKTGKSKGLLFTEPVSNYYSMSYDNGLLFIGASDYKTDGDMYVYDSKGVLNAKFDTKGLNPQKAICW